MKEWKWMGSIHIFSLFSLLRWCSPMLDAIRSLKFEWDFQAWKCDRVRNKIKCEKNGASDWDWVFMDSVVKVPLICVETNWKYLELSAELNVVHVRMADDYTNDCSFFRFLALVIVELLEWTWTFFTFSSSDLDDVVTFFDKYFKSTNTSWGHSLITQHKNRAYYHLFLLALL